MKKLLLVCAAMVAVLVSCLKDNEDKIVGTWRFESFVLTQTINGITTDTTYLLNNRPSIIMFRKDGAITDNLTGSHNHVVPGFNAQDQIDPELGYVYPSAEEAIPWNRYIIDGNKLTLYCDNYPSYTVFYGEAGKSEFSIITLNKSTLVILLEVPLANDGKVQFTYTLKKQ